MDYATPSLLGVLAFLAFAIYTRLGHLKKAAGERREPKAATQRKNDVQMYCVNAKLEGQTMTVKRDANGQDLFREVSRGKVKEIFMKGKAFAVKLQKASDNEDSTKEGCKASGGAKAIESDGGFKLDLDNAKAESPFMSSSDRDLEILDFTEVYLMAH